MTPHSKFEEITNEAVKEMCKVVCTPEELRRGAEYAAGIFDTITAQDDEAIQAARKEGAFDIEAS